MKLLPYKELKKPEQDPLIAAIMKDRQNYVKRMTEELHRTLAKIGINPKDFKIVKKK